jgi:membrane protein YdbS with pleckstrin-like domain
MYNSFRQFAERLLRIPPDPEPPPGDETRTRLFRAAPAYYKYLLLLWALKSLLALFIVSAAMIGPAVGAFVAAKRGHPSGLLLLVIPGLVFAVLIALRLFALALVRLDFEKRWYVVTNRSLRVREGVVIVREMTVTFANIQNIAISQGPIQRALGLADLRVDTAGGGAVNTQKNQGQNLHTAWFRGVNNAAEVRQVIQDRLRQFKDTGLGDHDDRPAAAPSSATAVLAALRDLDHEARALRETVTRLSAESWARQLR